MLGDVVHLFIEVVELLVTSSEGSYTFLFEDQTRERKDTLLANN